jgi:hypothetical protein
VFEPRSEERRKLLPWLAGAAVAVCALTAAAGLAVGNVRSDVERVLADARRTLPDVAAPRPHDRAADGPRVARAMP